MLVVVAVGHLVLYEVAERLGGDGHGVGQDHAAVTTRAQHQLVVEMVVANTPDPVQDN